jgi:DNA-binding transcriptional LysR family regulator
MSQLEKRLGVTLIDRSVRPLALTEAGQMFLAGCEELLQRYDRLEHRVMGMQEDPEGPVRVAAIYSAGIELLDHIRERFEAAHPKITVQIRYDQPEGVYRAVREQACDVGMVSYPERWRQVGIIPLRNETMAVVCHPGYELAGRAKITAGELAGYPLVTFDADLPAGRRIRRYLRDHGVTPRIAKVFDNVDTIKSAVALTDGIAILPKRTVMREVKAGTLALLELEPSLVRPIGVIYRRRNRQGAAFAPAVQAFVDFLLEHAGPKVDLVGEMDKQGQSLVGVEQ